MSAKKNVSAEEVWREIERIASSLEISPADISRTMFTHHSRAYSTRQLAKVGGLPVLKATFLSATPEQDPAQVRTISGVRQEINKLRRELGDRNALFDTIRRTVSHIPAAKIIPYKQKKSEPILREITLNTSDAHHGSYLEEAKGCQNFGPLEESRTFAGMTKTVLDYKKDYRDNTGLTVNDLGDDIENIQHYSGQARLSVQISSAIWYRIHMLGQFANQFPRVTVRSKTGNHGRFTSLHPMKATAEKQDSIETCIWFSVRMALQHLPNITWDMDAAPYAIYQLFKKWNYFAAHGDTNFNPGNPGKAINIENLQNKAYKWNAERANKIHVFQVGHVHTPVIIMLPDGTYIIINGALIPANEYAQTLNITNNRLTQWLYETTEAFPVGDQRLIDVTNARKDKALDMIIPPFKGVFL